jgi:uncharacterized protein YcfJ
MSASKYRLNHKLIISSVILALFSATPSLAGSKANGGFKDTAWVVSSTPIYENINDPRRECWDEQVSYEQREEVRGSGSNVGSTILGGIVGGVLGNSIGKGDGRKAATAAGVALGAMAGDNYGDDRRGYVRSEPRTRIEQRCRNVDNWSRKLTGYDVVYRYQGHEYVSFLPYDPGNSVRVNVNISLDER